MIETILIPTVINVLLIIILIVYIKRTMRKAISDLDQVMSSMIDEPMVKKAMSILGQHSGVKRAEKAVVDKFNRNLPNLFPGVSKIAEMIGMEPSEILQLIQDPLIGPFIQQFLGGALKGAQKGVGRAAETFIREKLQIPLMGEE